MRLLSGFMRTKAQLVARTDGALKNASHLSELCQTRRLKDDQILGKPIKTFQTGNAQFNIRTNANEFAGQLTPAGSAIELADLECHLSNCQRLTFNLTWLRDSCHCEKCTHKFSRQRLFTPKEFRRPLFDVDSIELVPNGAAHGNFIASPSLTKKHDSSLNIRWADGHASFYSLDWLKTIHGLYDKPLLGSLIGESKPCNVLIRDDYYSPKHDASTRHHYWTVSDINSGLEPVDYNDLVDGFNFDSNQTTFINANRISDMSTNRFDAILSLVQQLTTFGLAKIVNVPRERDHVLKLARSLAYERPTGYGTVFDVVVEPSEEINLAYSSQEFDLHSDLTYRETSPGVQMLHCISNSVDGGLSYFSDAFKAAEIMRYNYPEFFDVLLKWPVVFVVRDPYRDVKFRHQKPILTQDFMGDLKEVYYSPFMLPPLGHRDDLKLFYLAQDQFTRLLQAEENKFVTKMNSGDLFIFNNRRVLHGRSPYDPKTGKRFLQGCYMDWDEITCLYEKLCTNKRS